MEKHREKKQQSSANNWGRDFRSLLDLVSDRLFAQQGKTMKDFFSHRLIFTSGHIANYYRLEKADPSFTYLLNCNTFKQTSRHDITRKVRYSNMTLHIQTVWWSETSTGNICLNLATIQVQIMKLYPVCQRQCCDHRRLLSLGFPSWSLRAEKHKFEVIT